GGERGYGQALPRSYLTGETVEEAEDSIRNQWWPAIRALEFAPSKSGWEWLGVLDPLYRRADAKRKNASYAALEIAVVDALARACGVSAAALWRGSGGAVPLVGVVPAVGPRKAALMARAYRLLGYKRLKVKVGDDPGSERERVAAVRGAAGKGMWLALDANAAWNRVVAPARIAALAPFEPALIEEPLADGREPGALPALEKETGVETMADESLVSLRDAARFLTSGGPSWWNLRIAKVGGFSGMRALGELARENGVKIFGGVLVGETSALAAAGRACLGLAEFQCMEYGFPRFLLKGDPFRGGPGGFGGMANPLDVFRPGLGVSCADIPQFRRQVDF
ncbi:MAG: hypothetical protein LBT97_05750, partial [Planctomycetota bacterium]|nr:hypothetical protein [Planctomycetota bacterium]